MNSGLKAGFAEVVITPPVGCRLAGYSARTLPSTGVLDDLYAKVMVLENGVSKLVLVVCDVLGFSGSIVRSIRGRIESDIGSNSRRK